MTDKEFQKQWSERAKAKAPKKAKPKKAKAKVILKTDTLTSLTDFVKGVKGTTLASGRTPQGRKEQALKALYRALERRGWTAKGDSMTFGVHTVEPFKGIDFAVSVDRKYRLSLGKGAILEVDGYMSHLTGD